MQRIRKPKPLNKNGAIAYIGPSFLVPGETIVVIVTGLKRRSKNPKTGDELQTWILLTDVSPWKAVITGRHQAICGVGDRGCPLMGVQVPGLEAIFGRGCYVNVGKAPSAIYACFKRGGYRMLEAGELTGRILRVGSYGDPAAVPPAVWQAMVSEASHWTGYTHQWAWTDRAFAAFGMASVDTADERDRAMAAGWRTFRVINDIVNAPIDPTREVLCPASKEAGYRTTCADCKLCQGTSTTAKSVAIYPHGSGAGQIIPLAMLRTVPVRPAAAAA